MSGGAWGYQQYRLEELAERVAASIGVLAVVEHELDWGVSADTCLDCARVRVARALEEFFERGTLDGWEDGLVAATAVADERGYCPHR